MMKQLLTIALLFLASTLFAQTLYTRTDTLVITGDSVTLKTGDYRGTIQWQRSLNGTTWENITAQTDSILRVASADQGFYRAQITDAICNPVYSDTVAVVPATIEPATVTSPEEITGSNLLERDDSIFTFLTTSEAIIPDNTVFVSSDHVSDIRVVTDIVKNSDTLVVNTRQGTLEDLFINQEFSLSTEVLEETTKSAYTTKEAMANASIDSKGVIHPIKVIDNNSSLKSSQITNESVPTVNYKYDFSGLELWKEGGASISVSEGYFNLGAELKYDFKFESATIDWSKLQFNKGKLTKFKIYTNEENTGIESKIILKASSDYEHSFDEDIPIKENVFNKFFFYLIPPYEIPFWANIKIDLMAKATGKFESAASVSGGMTSSANFSVGAKYENGTWEEIQSSSTSFNLEGPTLEGHIKMERRIEVYPRFEIEFYSTVAPSLEIASYVEDEMESSLMGNFNYGLYSGVDARIGVDVNILGSNVIGCSYPSIKLKRDTLYEAPKKLEIISGENQKAEAGDTLSEPIVIRVLDSKEIPVTDALVYFKSETGKLFKKDTSLSSKNLEFKSATFTANTDSIEVSVATDSTGQVEIYYIVEDSTREQEIESYLKNGSDNIIEVTRTYVYAEADSCDCPNIMDKWMTENLNIYVPTVDYNGNGYAEFEDIFCWDNAPYGKLYTWKAAQSACPAGWHLPSDAEWQELVECLGGNFVAGGKMKATTGWKAPNTEATNSSGFSALPGGICDYNGTFVGQGSSGAWWTSTPYDAYLAYHYFLGYNRAYCHHNTFGSGGLSVRCVRD